jgi:prephenate dehydrogenase
MEGLFTHHGLNATLARQLVYETTAAAQFAPSGERLKQRTILLVGGQGMMGQFFRQCFTEEGATVRSLDQNDWPQARTLCTSIDLALIAVPIHRTQEIIQRLCPLLEPTTLLADITSLKVMPMTTMLEGHSGPVLGLHPMFGPKINHLQGQTILYCLGRMQAHSWLLDFFTARGAVLRETEPSVHDQMMAHVQALRHFITMAYGSFLASQELDLERLLTFSSPVYRLELDMITRLFAQQPDLYADIILGAADRIDLASPLAQHISEMAHLVSERDREGLISRFQEGKRTLQREGSRALEETAYLIEALAAKIALDHQDAPNRTP